MGRHAAASVTSDAFERATRTLWQGFLVDALAAVGLGLGALLASGDLASPIFWSAAGLLVAKSFLTALASFLARLTSTPKNAATPPEKE